MSTENDLPKLEDMYQNTVCYTYKVTMLVQILAPDKEIADLKLDRDGGYISKRDVELVDSVLLYNGSTQLQEEDI